MFLSTSNLYTYSVPYGKFFYACLSLVATILLISLLTRLLILRNIFKTQTVCLELTPPASSNKSLQATQQLLMAIYSLGRQRSSRDKLYLKRPIFALEVVSTKTEGVRYVVRLSSSDQAVFEQQLAAYLPEIRFKTTQDYLLDTADIMQGASVTEFKQGRHFAYPLAQKDSLVDYDPLAYLTGAMTKRRSGEMVAFQLVVAPLKLRSARKLHNKLLAGKLPHLSNDLWQLCFRLLRAILNLVVGLMRAILSIFSEITGSNYSLAPDYSQAPTAAAHDVIDSMNNKLGQPLFRTTIRTLVVSKDKQRTSQTNRAVCASLAAFGSSGYQALLPKSWLPMKLRSWLFIKRLPDLVGPSGNVLSVSEVAALYHFPYSQNSKTENIAESLSRTLPAPTAQKRHASNYEFDVVLGRNKHHGEEHDLGLTDEERQRHVFILGGTGNGKTTMLRYSLVQDIHSGKGVAVIDPHGDLASSILSYIPKQRLNDVIYLNPDDLEHPVGLNLLELPQNLSPKDRLREQDFVTEAIVSIFRKFFSDDDTGGHRIEYLLRNCIQTAFTIPDATIFTIYRLLTSNAYRIKMTAHLEDEDLKNFWANEYGKAGSYQQVKMSAGLTAKIGRFRSSASARSMLEQPNSTINFDEILDCGKILICNLAKGLIGEDTSQLLGTTIITKLQLAGYRRARLDQAQRRPFYVYVDEFQNFATTSFVQLLSEARKYKLFLTMAEQSAMQQSDPRMVETILNNVGTVICFRSGSPADEKLLLPFFQPSITVGEIANLPAYSFYMKLAAVSPHQPVSGETIQLTDKGSRHISQLAANLSQLNYTLKTASSKT